MLMHTVSEGKFRGEKQAVSFAFVLTVIASGIILLSMAEVSISLPTLLYGVVSDALGACILYRGRFSEYLFAATGFIAAITMVDTITVAALGWVGMGDVVAGVLSGQGIYRMLVVIAIKMFETGIVLLVCRGLRRAAYRLRMSGGYAAMIVCLMMGGIGGVYLVTQAESLVGIMRGLIYKEFSCFYRGIDKKLIIIAVAAMALLLYKAGSYGGLLASVMLEITVGMQNCMCIAGDEKSGWKKYQMAMPLGKFKSVAGKYVSVLCTMGISLAGSIAFSLISRIIAGGVDISISALSAVTAVIVPMMWTGICLSLTYWFGIQSAQTMGLVAMVPIFYLIKYFEDGPGFSVMTDSFYSCLPVACIAASLLFGLSLVINAAGYGRKK